MATKNENLVMIHGLLGSLSFFEPERYFSKLNLFTPSLYCYDQEPCLKNLELHKQAEYVEEIIVKKIKKPSWILGHSVGGVIAMILAANNPKMIKGIINVEGNFSLKDAFWTQKIAKMDKEAWQNEYEGIKDKPAKWLEKSNIELSVQRKKWAKEILDFQTALSVQTVAKAVITETSSKHYQDVLDTVLNSDIPIHLIAGEYSKQAWDVPQTYLDDNASFSTINNTGHMMMLENPAEFCRTVENIVVKDEL